jgi:hypothetical protein
MEVKKRTQPLVPRTHWARWTQWWWMDKSVSLAVVCRITSWILFSLRAECGLPVSCVTVLPLPARRIFYRLMRLDCMYSQSFFFLPLWYFVLEFNLFFGPRVISSPHRQEFGRSILLFLWGVVSNLDSLPLWRRYQDPILQFNSSPLFQIILSSNPSPRCRRHSNRGPVLRYQNVAAARPMTGRRNGFQTR